MGVPGMPLFPIVIRSEKVLGSFCARAVHGRAKGYARPSFAGLANLGY